MEFLKEKSSDVVGNKVIAGKGGKIYENSENLIPYSKSIPNIKFDELGFYNANGVYVEFSDKINEYKYSDNWVVDKNLKLQQVILDSINIEMDSTGFYDANGDYVEFLDGVDNYIYSSEYYLNRNKKLYPYYFGREVGSQIVDVKEGGFENIEGIWVEFNLRDKIYRYSDDLFIDKKGISVEENPNDYNSELILKKNKKGFYRPNGNYVKFKNGIDYYSYDKNYYIDKNGLKHDRFLVDLGIKTDFGGFYNIDGDYVEFSEGVEYYRYSDD